MSVTHNKKRNPFLNILINCISEGTAPQILSIKDERTFNFSDFLIICFCNSSANPRFDMISLLIVSPADLFRIAKVSDFVGVSDDFLSKHL